MGNNTLVIANLSDDQYAKIAAALGFEAPETDAADTPAPESGKAGKKDKKGKGKKSEPEVEETTTVETFTKKALEKKERAELVSITEALGLSAEEVKGKRAPTLVQMILDKQKAIANAADEGDDDDFKADDDGWNEDVPPADDPKPEKVKKGKDKGDKKKGKKKK